MWLILIGIGLEAIATALIQVMIVFGEIFEVSQALIWLIVFIPLAFFYSRHLNALSLGDEVAQGLGSRIELQRGALLLTSVALAASAVATAGTITFVGLMAPHIARRFVGPSHGGLLPTAAMTGGMLVVLADLLGRVMFGTIEIPCGIITALIGAPFFLYLLYPDHRACAGRDRSSGKFAARGGRGG